MNSLRLEDLNFLEKIGEGSSSEVFRAMHKLTNRIYAVKVISKDYSLIEMQRIRNEIRISTKICHPFIVKVFDTFEDQTSIFVVMEYIPNGTLLKLVSENGKLKEEEAKKYFVQIVDALSYLHERQKIVHRDLKCENIMLDSNNDVRLIDFGFSKYYDNTALKTICGSLQYTAPEILLGKEYDNKVDIWSLGVILYSMVHGYYPFTNEKQNLLIKAIEENDPIFNKDLSSELKNLMTKMLIKDPSQRISLFDIKTHPWISSAYSQFVKNSEQLMSFRLLNQVSFRKSAVSLHRPGLRTYNPFQEKNTVKSITQLVSNPIKVPIRIRNSNTIQHFIPFIK